MSAMETAFSRAARSRALDRRQRSVIIGSLLGDGTLLDTTAGWCFRLHHGIRQYGYLFWKYQALAGLVRTPPRASAFKCYFRTVTHPAFIDLRAAFYQGRRKIVPYELLTADLDSLALAVWIMDDGSADGSALRLNTQSFSREENQALIEILGAKFGLKPRINKDKAGFRLRFPSSDMSRLRELVGEHVHPQMAYKLGCRRSHERPVGRKMCVII